MRESTWFVLLCMAYGWYVNKGFFLKNQGVEGLGSAYFLNVLEWIEGVVLNLKFLLDKG